MPCIKCCSSSTVLNFLKGADKVCDYVPLISSVSNAVDLIGKGVFAINKHCCHGNLSQHNRYFRHLNDKSALRCIAGAIPFIGNAGLAIYDVCKLCCKGEEYLSSSDSSESENEESSHAGQPSENIPKVPPGVDRENKNVIDDASSADELSDVKEKQPPAVEEEKQPLGGSDSLDPAPASKENTLLIDSAPKKPASSKERSSKRKIRQKKPSKSKKAKKPVFTDEQQKSFVASLQKIGEFFELSEVFSKLNKEKIKNVKDENDLGKLAENAILFNMVILNIIREINEISQLKGYSIYRDLSRLDVIVERDGNQFMGCFKAFNGIYQTWLAGQEGIDCDDGSFKKHLQNFDKYYQEWLGMTEQINDLKTQVSDDNNLLNSIYEPPSNDLKASVIGGGLDALLKSLLRVEGEVNEMVVAKEEKQETPEPSDDEPRQIDVSILFTNSVIGDVDLNQLKGRYLNNSLTDSQDNQNYKTITEQADAALASLFVSTQNPNPNNGPSVEGDNLSNFQELLNNPTNPFSNNSSAPTYTRPTFGSLPDLDFSDPSEKKEPATVDENASKNPSESEKSETKVKGNLKADSSELEDILNVALEDFAHLGSHPKNPNPIEEPATVEGNADKQSSESEKSETKVNVDLESDLNELEGLVDDFVFVEEQNFASNGTLQSNEPNGDGNSQPQTVGFINSFLGMLGF